MNKLILLASLVLTPITAVTEQLSIERIHQSPALAGSTPEKLKISPDGKRITFIRGKAEDYQRYDLWQYEVASGKTEILFDADDLSTGEQKLSDEEKARRERQRQYGSGIMNYQWSADGQALIFPLGGDAYYANVSTKSVRKVLDTDAFETDIKLSPKGTFISFVREQNLYVIKVATGEETQITAGGGGLIKYGMAEFVAQEEMSRTTGYWWSPDESSIAFTKVDMAPVGVITRSEIYADSIKMIEQRYPLAGTANVTIELAVFKFASKKTTWLDLGSNKDFYLPRVQWQKDSQNLTYQWQSRDQKQLVLRNYNLDSRKTSVVITETANTWLNLHSDLYFLDDNAHFVWASERDGFKHLYLYKNTGELVQQITKGHWVVDQVEAIDNSAKRIYFTGRKDTPLEKHLYQVGFEGKNIQKVSQRQGFHSVAFGKDASVYVDNFSTINTPPQVSLHSSDGARITWLSENKVTPKHALGQYQKQWIKPIFGTLKTEEGIDLHYQLFKPHVVQGKHPVLVFTYGGPRAQVVRDRWGGKRGLLMQYFVNKGYVVFTLDNRGSNYRGKAFEDAIYRAMGSVEVEDQVTGVKYLRSLPFVDPQRIGIYGHSYGGYMVQMAMFKQPDYFQVGISGAPVTDWGLYDTHYTERYMGNPNEIPESYKASSVFPYAKNLKGAMLVYHGMADDNVLFTHSTKLFKHLQDLSIPFETMVYPGKKHSLRGKNTAIHLNKTMDRFFDRHLMER